MKEKTGIDSFILHILAMTFMLCDHLWATLLPGQEWLTCVGRLAFPIFAFMIAEGYAHTSNVKKYMGRLFVFALISEIPFNLIMGSSLVYPFHQNVLWTFLLGVLSMQIIEKARKTEKKWLLVLTIVFVILGDYILGTLTMVDYNAAGVLTVLLFYFFRTKNWVSLAAQVAGLFYLNVIMLGDLYYPVTILGHEFEIAQQGFALLALIPIWLYNGKQGYHKKWFQYFCYAFYPVHLLLLYLMWQWWIR